MKRPVNWLQFVFVMAILTALAGCGSSGSSGGSDSMVSSDSDSDDAIGASTTVFTPDYVEIQLSGLSAELGNFDPAPTVDANGDFWMSYSHVSSDASGLKLIETRLASSADSGSNWADSGIKINSASAFMIDSNTVAWAQEVSRLVYNPFALSVGADPWIVLWHRYLSILDGADTQRLFDNGWIAMKSGATPMALANERKLFTGAAYNALNDVTIGAAEVRLDQLDAALEDCIAFSEPGLLAKSEGVYVSLLCATATLPGKIILLGCDHRVANCRYLGDLVDGGEAAAIDPDYDNFSASELVTVAGEDYLVVTPSNATIYRGCVFYRITSLPLASIERVDGVAKPFAVIKANGDFNGACGYVDGLDGSGVMISEAFLDSIPVFRLFATGFNMSLP